jgi:hypothetical protein
VGATTRANPSGRAVSMVVSALSRFATALVAAATTSRLMIRPPGPLPRSEARSTPSSSAMRRATGLTRSLRWGSGVGVGAGAGSGVGAAACSEGADAEAALVGAAAGVPFATVAVSSPFSAISAIGVPTFTCCPASTRIFATVPSSKHCISIVALSVSMSASTSPERTASPSFTFHLMTVPASMVSERRGIVREIDMGSGS